MPNKKIILVDNSQKHLKILNEVLKDNAGFDVITLRINENNSSLVSLQIEKLLKINEKFLLLIDIWLTKEEETEQGPSCSGVDLALEIYDKYKQYYGKSFVISLLTAYDLDYVITVVEKHIENSGYDIPLETKLESFKQDKEKINLPFYVIKKPIYQDKLRSDYFPASLYENLTGIQEYDYTKAMINIINARLEMLFQ